MPTTYRQSVPSPPVTASAAGAWAQIGAITLGLLAAVGGLSLATRWLTGELRRERAAKRRARGGASVAVIRRPVEAVAADLRRLGREISLVSAGTPAARRRGLQAAYDDVLVEAAAALEVPHQLGELPPGEARELERLRLTAALTDAGLVLTDPRFRG